jgi:large subunit ribosomal protein L15
MKYNELKLVANKSPKRVGRGIASGQGKTAGRGTKGQMSRTGSNKRPGFEGGQNPLMVRLPKLRGFRSFKPSVAVIYTSQLDQFAGKVVDSQALSDAGLIKNAYQPIKLIVQGAVTKKVTVKLPAASATAIKLVEAAGGTFSITDQLLRTATDKSKKATRKKSKEPKD